MGLKYKVGGTLIGMGIMNQTWIHYMMMVDSLLVVVLALQCSEENYVVTPLDVVCEILMKFVGQWMASNS